MIHIPTTLQKKKNKQWPIQGVRHIFFFHKSLI